MKDIGSLRVRTPADREIGQPVLAPTALFPMLPELRWAHLNVPKNATERADFEYLVSMNRHGRFPALPFQIVVTASDADQLETLPAQKAHHFLAARPGQITHARRFERDPSRAPGS